MHTRRGRAIAVLLCAATVAASCATGHSARPVVTYTPTPHVAPQLAEARTEARHDRYARWYDSAHWQQIAVFVAALDAQRQAAADAERARVAAAAPRATTRPPAPRRAPQPHTGRSGGSCDGWLDLVSSLWPASQVPKACRVLDCESSGDPTARNKSGAIGLFQLLGHGGTTDPVQNATVAHRLWLSEGWSPWVCQ